MNPEREIRLRSRLVAAYSFGLCAALCVLAVPIPVLARERFHATSAQIGIMGTIGMIIYTGGAMLGGRLADRFSYRRLITLSCLVCAVCSLACPLLPGFTWLVAANTLILLGLAFFWPALMAWMSTSSPVRALPIVLMVFNLGWCIGQLVGDYLGGEFYGLMKLLPFFIAAGICAFFAALTMLIPRDLWRRRTEVETQARVEETDILPPHAEGFVWIGWSANLICALLLWGMRAIFPPWAVSPTGGLHFSTRVIGILLASQPAVQMVVFWLLGRWHGWHYRLLPLIIAQGFGAAGCWIAMSARTPLGFAAGFILMGVFIGLAYNSSLFYSVHGQANTGQRAGLHEGIAGIGAIVGPAMFGFASDLWSPRSPYYIMVWLMIGLSVLQIVFLFLWKRLSTTREKDRRSLEAPV